MAVLLLLMLAQQSQNILNYRVTGDPDHGFLVRADAVKPQAVAALNDRIAAEAAKRCADKQPKMGKFTFASRYDATHALVGVTNYSQAFTCVFPVASAAANVPSDWQASGQDEAQVRSIAIKFFQALDRGDSAAAYAFVDPEALARTDIDETVAASKSLGLPQGHHIDAVTWYVNPADAPKPGAYVAIDQHGEYEGLDEQCGYIVLYRDGPGRYLLTRQETANLAKGAAKDPAARAAAHCLK